ncbi:MAG: SWIM zinc finger family protein [Thermanaerothrix sp.]|uniref:SWIM zinc finger family protein n=1 Tax=Thermanaerothrix sp. TaxID=2972675 RepID=UPI003C7D0527
MSQYHDAKDREFTAWGPRQPRKAKGGIKAISARGEFGKNWWSRRWIQALEQITDLRRLQRGRIYARAGQVLKIKEREGGIEALVQGSRPRPYKVTIRLTPLTPRQWEKVLDVLADQAVFAAQLLAGEMPPNIEEAFAAAGVNLFPIARGDLFTSCSCPDSANPCKHIAATHYILGERFDEDPFLLFRMRGRSQDQILEELRQRRGVTLAKTVRRATQPTPLKREHPQPLDADWETFWNLRDDLDHLPFQMQAPTIPQPLLKRLGDPGIAAGLSLSAQLEATYAAVTQMALFLAYGDLNSNGGGETPSPAENGRR